MKKTLAVLLALVLVVGMFAGCGNSGGEGATSGESLTVAVVETAYDTGVWNKVCEAFTEQTGIRVSLSNSIVGSEDVVHLPTGFLNGITEQNIKDKKLHDLSNVLSMTIPGESITVAEKLDPGFLNTSLTCPYGDGKMFLAPVLKKHYGLVYNTTLFEAKHWSVPTTWDEMWVLADTALAEGIYLFTYATPAELESLIYALAYSVGGAEFFNDIANYKDGAWESSNGNKLLKIINKLAKYTHPTTPVNANEQDFNKNRMLILNNQAIFMPYHTGINTEMINDEASLTTPFSWGKIALPAMTDGEPRYSYCVAEQTWIPADAANMAQAEKFVAFLYSDKAAEIFATKGATVALKKATTCLSSESVACTGAFSAFNVADMSVSSVYFEPFSKLVAGQISSNDYANGIKAVQANLRENLID